MTARVRTTARADRQILQAGAWWRGNRPAAPNLLTSEIAAAFSLLENAADIASRYRRRGIPGLRRLLLPRTRYHVYYVHDPTGEVLVLAVWSAVRGRGPPLSGQR